MTEEPFVFVHGDYHGGWCWDGVRARLGDRPTSAVDLPSSGSDTAALGTRADDAAVLRRAVAEAGGPVVVVAHSASGIVTCEALAGHPDVRGVVFLAAVVLDRGETVADVVGHSDMSWADVHADAGYVDVPDPIPTFYADVDRPLAEAAAGRLTAKSAVDVLTPATVAIADWGWPSAYVVCERDRAISPVDEALMAARTGRTHSLASSHSPFLSMPDVLADLLVRVADSFAAGDPA